MNDLLTDLAELRSIIVKLDGIGGRMNQYVPANPKRDDHMDLAVRSVWNAKRCAQWAVNEGEAAINEAVKGGE